jgi:hypothetical protein
MHPRLIPFGTGYGDDVQHPVPATAHAGDEMTQSDDPTQEPWTDPQTHLDTDPVNAEPEPEDPAAEEEDES